MAVAVAVRVAATVDDSDGEPETLRDGERELEVLTEGAREADVERDCDALVDGLAGTERLTDLLGVKLGEAALDGEDVGEGVAEMTTQERRRRKPAAPGCPPAPPPTKLTAPTTAPTPGAT